MALAALLPRKAAARERALPQQNAASMSHAGGGVNCATVSGFSYGCLPRRCGR